MRMRHLRCSVWLCCGVLGLGLLGCGPADSQQSVPVLRLTAEEVAEGQRVVRLHCATCHGVDDQTRESMLAPSLWAVRQHYIRKYPEPEAFVEGMLAFLEHPQLESSLMPQASEEYGLMALLPLDEAQLRASIRLIYAGHVERPVWARDYDKAHASCYEQLQAEAKTTVGL